MRRAVRAKAIIESAIPVPYPSGTLDNIEELKPTPKPLHEDTFDIGPVSNPEDTPEEPKPLNEDKLAEIRVFKHKLMAYKKSFPGKFSNLNWSSLDGKKIEEIEELYSKVMLTFNHGYQKSAGMVGIAYQTMMSGLEGETCVSDLVKSGARAIGKAAPIVYHKAKDVANTLYNDTKDLGHQPFQVLSNLLTMATVGIGGIAVIYALTKF